MVMIIEREMYGIRSFGVAWRNTLAENLKSLGYNSSESDTDVWMNLELYPSGDPYCKYMLCYCDNLNLIYGLKEGFVPPNRYLVANVEIIQF